MTLRLTLKPLRAGIGGVGSSAMRDNEPTGVNLTNLLLIDLLQKQGEQF